MNILIAPKFNLFKIILINDNFPFFLFYFQKEKKQTCQTRRYLFFISKPINVIKKRKGEKLFEESKLVKNNRVVSFVEN